MNLDCRRWAELADRDALGEPLPSGGRAFQREHEATCADCAREAAVWRAAKVCEDDEPVEQVEVQRILRVAAAGGRRTALSPRWKGALVFVGGAVACAAALLLWLSGRFTPAPGHALRSPLAAGLSQRLAPLARQALARREGMAEASPHCSQVGTGVTVCLGPGAVLARRVLTGPHRELEVAKGRAVVSLAPQAPGTSFSLTSAAGKVTAVGTIFSVEITGEGATVARVVEGKVLVRTAQSDIAQPLRAGQALRLGEQVPTPLSDQERDVDIALLALSEINERGASLEPSAPKPAVRGVGQSAPRDMLEYARSLRASGDFRGAAEVYRKVHADNPQSPSGRAALVSRGELLLNLGDGQTALGAFDAYLLKGGALAQEATFGRVRALRALGRQPEEQRAIQQFLAAYPEAPQSRVLRARLAAIQK